jgi:4-hydroxy-tetrahydrodipicolinate synthase
LQAGGAGCISATANYQVGNIRKLIDTPDGEARTKLDAEVSRVRSVFEKLPLIPALKAAAASQFKRDSWRIVRPPLREFPADKRPELLSALGLAH